MSTGSQGTSPLLAAGATDRSSGNIPANGSSVTRYTTADPIVYEYSGLMQNTANFRNTYCNI